MAPAGRCLRALVAAASLALLHAGAVRADAPIVSEWSGTWSRSNPRTAYDARMHLEVDATGRVEGRIAWTLRVAPDPSEQARVGKTGTEFVTGTYAAPGVLLLAGTREEDPDSVVGLDKYRLFVADGGASLVGISASPTQVLGAVREEWQGRLELARVGGSLGPLPVSATPGGGAGAPGGGGSAGPRTNPPAPTSPGLAGTWNGTHRYSQPAGWASSGFRLRVFQDGGEFVGRMEESGASRRIVEWVYEGTLGGSAVRFRKSNHSRGPHYEIAYEGTLSPDGASIRGTWADRIGPGRGTFEMTRR
jgi:hypothetical protein